MTHDFIGNTIGRLTHWDLRFMDMTKLISTWSRDPSTKVGTVIADDMNRFVSAGFNGLPQGVEDTPERYAERETKYKMSIHGELNAILFAGRSLVGCKMYTYPFPPCSRCAGVIAQVGITQVIGCYPSEDILSRWESDLVLAAKICDEAGVNLYLADYK